MQFNKRDVIFFFESQIQALTLFNLFLRYGNKNMLQCFLLMLLYCHMYKIFNGWCPFKTSLDCYMITPLLTFLIGILTFDT